MHFTPSQLVQIRRIDFPAKRDSICLIFSRFRKVENSHKLIRGNLICLNGLDTRSWLFIIFTKLAPC
ncbi:hypothetical protein DVR14_09140 [Natrinema thermotolerans]|nr:hypothetical protein DVR14_09140 [Natrinema thermotolerans]